ncbi:hypothetical protein GJ496_006311, partial [Pomphorhynchus laevis]
MCLIKSIGLMFDFIIVILYFYSGVSQINGYITIVKREPDNEVITNDLHEVNFDKKIQDYAIDHKEGGNEDYLGVGQCRQDGGNGGGGNGGGGNGGGGNGGGGNGGGGNGGGGNGGG